MRLPGGVWVDGKLQREVGFRPVHGHIELAINECNTELEATPSRVTSILLAALESLAGRPPDEEAIWKLAVGDRQFLMRQLAVHLGKDEKWYSADCRSCDEVFDFPILQSRLPVKEAGESYPYVKVKTALGELRFHVPTGKEQAAIQDETDIEKARLRLLRCCLETENDGEICFEDLSGDDIRCIEQAMEEVAPEVGNLVETQCPVCGQVNRVSLDPYAPVFERRSELFTQIHILAATYHWSQNEILDLPTSRRMTYLGLIDQARGMVE